REPMPQVGQPVDQCTDADVDEGQQKHQRLQEDRRDADCYAEETNEEVCLPALTGARGAIRGHDIHRPIDDQIKADAEIENADDVIAKEERAEAQQQREDAAYQIKDPRMLEHPGLYLRHSPPPLTRRVACACSTIPYYPTLRARRQSRG